MFDRWAREHERAFLTAFFLFVMLGLAALALETAADGHGAEIAAIWGGAFVLTLVAMLLRHRAGKLILRDPEDRERQRATNEKSLQWSWVVLVPLGVLFAIGAGGYAAAFLGGVFTALAPLMLWIAFVLRPDQRQGEHL